MSLSPATVQWHAAGHVTVEAGRKPVFPPVSESPALYRMTFTGAASDRPQRYVGEIDNLRRRLHSNYRGPGPSQQTSLRISSLLRAHLAGGGHVELAVATAAEVVIDETREVLDLTRKASRLLAENAVLVDAYRRGDVDIVNLG